jgi:hypothetical protein
MYRSCANLHVNSPAKPLLHQPLKVLAFYNIRPPHYESNNCLFQRQLWQPTADDAIYLGRELEADFVQIIHEELNDDYLGLLDQVQPRCEAVGSGDWKVAMGMRAWRKEGARFLDPTQEIDESNWWDKGWSLEMEPKRRPLQYGVYPRPISLVKYRRRSIAQRTGHFLLEDSDEDPNDY